jgi:hypothetical protein
MCFSVEADVVAGALLLPVAAVSLREVRHVRELPFASLPLLFALHQLTEAVVWAGVDHHAVPAWAQQTATVLYVGYALVVLPTLFPLAVLLLEPRHLRRRVAPYVVLGLVVSVGLGAAAFSGPITVVVHPHALEYSAGLWHGGAFAILYVVAVIGPSVMSGYRSVVAFGLVNLVGLVVVAILYREAFASLWCVYAALTSVFILVHMVRRRWLPDADRLV